MARENRNRRAAGRPGAAGFTLVELLVVITIIGILAALLLAAATRAIATARRAAILAEITQFATALEDKKNNVGSYPPNAQTDGSGGPLDDAAILAEFKRHFNKAFPRHREPAPLLEALCGRSSNTNSGSGGASNLPGGMNAAEALVFWMGGFSDDPSYPISGAKGPSYSLSGLGAVPPNAADPIDQRNWALDVNIQQLGPRGEDKYFDPTDGRFVVYADPINSGQQRRINFWHLKAPSSPAPYLYFDVSRSTSATALNDCPAAVQVSGFQYSGADSDALNQLFAVSAIKRLKQKSDTQEPFTYADTGKYQVLHAGIDEAWGVFPRVTGAAGAMTLVSPSGAALPLLFPDGPWTLELADTIANFASGTLEDAQP